MKLFALIALWAGLSLACPDGSVTLDGVHCYRRTEETVNAVSADNEHAEFVSLDSILNSDLKRKRIF